MKTVLTSLIMVISHVAFGQIAKGAMRLGPQLEYSSITQKDMSGLTGTSVNKDLFLGLGFGYYVIENLEIGVSLGYTSSKNQVQFSRVTTKGFLIGPEIHYKLTLTDKLYLPVGAGIQYNSTSASNGFTETKYTGVIFHIFSGLELVVNKQLGAYIHIGPQFNSFKDADSDDEFNYTVYAAGVGFNLYF